MESKELNGDHPIKEIDNDLFSRGSFATAISTLVKTRQSSECLVIGIYGAWGEGKTTVLNFIEKDLTKDDSNTLFFKFNPWRFGDEHSLLKSFYFDLAKFLGEKITNNGEFFAKIVKDLSAFATSGHKSETLNDILPETSLEEYKTRVQECLGKNGKRVAIIIDDIDRLDKNEIYALFRLVKLNADFEYVTYILSFDKNVVTVSLSERYAEKDLDKGNSFLEKIIQLPLYLPRVPEYELYTYTLNLVENALNAANITLERRDFSSFQRLFRQCFAEQIDTPRKAKLYGNSLLFVLPMLRGEVDIEDLLLLEALKAFDSRTYELLRRYASKLIGNENSFGIGRKFVDQKDFLSQFDAWFKTNNLQFQKTSLEVIRALFPLVDSVYHSSRAFRFSSANELYKNKKLCHPDYLDRYFTYTVLKTDVSDAKIQSFVDNLLDDSFDNQQRLSEFRNMLQLNQGSLRYKLESIKLTPEQSAKLAVVISRCSRELPHEKAALWTSLQQWTGLIYKWTNEIKLLDSLTLISQCILEAEDFVFTIFLAVEVTSQESSAYTEANKQELFELVKSKIDEARVLTNQRDGKYLFRALDVYRSVSSESDYQALVQRIVDENSGHGVFNLLASYTGDQSSYKYDGNGNFDQSSFLRLSETASIIKQKLNELSFLCPSEYPKVGFDVNDENKILAEQFLWCYENQEEFNAS